MTYATLIEKLYAINIQKNPTKYNLDTMLKLCALFESPQNQFQTVHVAGSNGKGSVTTKMAQAFQLSGLKVGLYTSPHISCFRERIRLNGELIPEEQVTILLSKIFHTIEQYEIKVSFFEITTLLAFCYYAQEKVDIAVIETGLGGRLDSTNVVTPLLSLITSISLEHTSILGETLPEIAREKGGIIKPNIPVVIGPRVPFEEINVIAEAKRSPLYVVEGSFATFDEENSSIAKKGLELLKIPSESIQEGCKVLPPCRVEKIVMQERLKENHPIAIILDVAHNPDGLSHLFSAVKKGYPGTSIRVVCGLSQNKDISNCIEILKKNGNAFHIIQANSSRALPCDLLYQEFIQKKVPKDQLFLDNSIEKTMETALELATLHREILIVCGSFFIMAPVRAYLGIIEPTDILDLNETAIPAKT